MKQHTTNFKSTKTARPRHTAKMTADQIVSWCTANWGMSIDDAGKGTPTNKTTAFMVEVSETYFDPSDWKNGFTAFAPVDCYGHDISEWVKAAAIWYHGSRAVEVEVGHNVGVAGTGYACW